MKRALVLLVVLVAAAAGLLVAGGYGFGPVVITKEGQQKIILIFGRPRAVTTPGVALRVPLLENVRELDRRLLYLNTPPSSITTRDQESLVVDNYAAWRPSRRSTRWCGRRCGRWSDSRRWPRW